MPLNVPLRYINDGEPLDEVTLNRYTQDTQANLENLFSRVDDYDPGTTDAISGRVVLRDNNATTRFGVPSHDQHPWRLNEFREFEYFLFDSSGYIRNSNLRKSSTDQQGIVQLVDSYTSNSSVMAPTADALRRAYNSLKDYVDDSISEVMDDIGSLKDEISDIETEISSIDNTINNLQSDQSDSKNDINTINSKISTIEGDIDTIFGNISDLSTEIDEAAIDLTNTIFSGDNRTSMATTPKAVADFLASSEVGISSASWGQNSGHVRIGEFQLCWGRKTSSSNTETITLNRSFSQISGIVATSNHGMRRSDHNVHVQIVNNSSIRVYAQSRETPTFYLVYGKA